MNRLYLVRHGEGWANVSKEFSYKKVDYSLTPKGILQAQQTASFFKAHCQDYPVDEIYASPLRRAQETAWTIAEALGLGVETIEDFRELNIGSLEGKPYSKEIWEVHDRIVANWFNGNPDMHFPGGENYPEMLERMRRGLSGVVAGKDGRNILIVAHAAIISFPLKDLCDNVDPVWLFQQRNQNCSITEIEAAIIDGNFKARLLTFAKSEHIHGIAAAFEQIHPVESGE